MTESSGEDGQGRDSFINIRKNPNIDEEKKEEEKEKNPCRMMPPLQKKGTSPRVQETPTQCPQEERQKQYIHDYDYEKDEKVARMTKLTANSKRRRAEESITGKEVRSRLRLPSHILELIHRSLYLASLGEEDFGRVCRTLIHNGIVVSCRT